MNTREISLNILLDVNENNSYSNMAISKHIPVDMTTQDANFIRELVYGVLENKIYIDFIISKASKIKLNKIHPAIRDILRLGIYQLVIMEKVPESAAVNESVKIAKKYGHKGSIGYVNGVLRSISRDIEGFAKIDIKDKMKYLSIKYSHPEYMVKRFYKDFGYEFTEALLIANNSKPLLNIRVNTLKSNKDELRKLLIDKGYHVKDGRYANDCLIIENPSRITELNEFKNGLFTIQDESSMLVAQILNPDPNSLVLDVCSAPGGKSTHMAQIMNNKGKIISRDIFAHKIKLLDENANRLGINMIQSQVYDALNLDNDLIEKVDYCLVDAPCSGLGLLRRKPEIKWNRELTDIKELANLQYNILDLCKSYVKPNGILMYSTCTILDEENIHIVNKFLSNNSEFKLISIEDEQGKFDQFETTSKGYIQLYPNIHFVDGFFIAKMVKER